jgi:hypothetical protein
LERSPVFTGLELEWADCSIAGKVSHAGIVVVLVPEIPPHIAVTLERDDRGDSPTTDVPTFRTSEDHQASARKRARVIQKQSSYCVIVLGCGAPAENSDQIALLSSQELIKGLAIDNEIEVVSTGLGAPAWECGSRPSAPAE